MNNVPVITVTVDTVFPPGPYLNTRSETITIGGFECTDGNWLAALTNELQARAKYDDESQGEEDAPTIQLA